MTDQPTDAVRRANRLYSALEQATGDARATARDAYRAHVETMSAEQLREHLRHVEPFES
jgi:hypothetical protein